MLNFKHSAIISRMYMQQQIVKELELELRKIDDCSNVFSFYRPCEGCLASQ